MVSCGLQWIRLIQGMPSRCLMAGLLFDCTACALCACPLGALSIHSLYPLAGSDSSSMADAVPGHAHWAHIRCCGLWDMQGGTGTRLDCTSQATCWNQHLQTCHEQSVPCCCPPLWSLPHQSGLWKQLRISRWFNVSVQAPAPADHNLLCHVTESVMPATV